MMLNANATILPGRGTVFIAEEPDAQILDYKTVDPRDPSTYTGYICLGHTSRENTVALSKDGGDASQLGSWWEAAIRESREPTQWSWTVNSLQVDRETMLMAFPEGEVEGGAFWVPGVDSTKERTALILCVDTTGRMGIHLPNTPIGIGDAPEIAVDSFFEIQLSGSILSSPATGRRIGFFKSTFDDGAAPDPNPEA